MFELVGETFVQMVDCCVVSDGKCCNAYRKILYTSAESSTSEFGTSKKERPDGPVAKRQKLNSVEDLLIIQKEQIDYRFTILKQEGDLFYVSF